MEKRSPGTAHAAATTRDADTTSMQTSTPASTVCVPVKPAAVASVATSGHTEVETRSPNAKRRLSVDAGALSSGRKRRRSLTSLGNNQDGVEDGDLRDDTLRLATEMLRRENRQLQADREALEAEKLTLSTRLEQSQRDFRALEDDVARIHRQKEKESEQQQLQLEKERQELQDKLRGAERAKAQQRIQQHSRNVSRGRGDRESTSLITQRSGVEFSAEATREMDAFLASCNHWQAKLTRSSEQLSSKTMQMEQKEVQNVVRDLVASVELSAQREILQTRDEQLQWLQQALEDASVRLAERLTQQLEMEEFEAMEKQLMEDRVVELETQLAQKRTVEHEKETELSLLRATQDELLQSSHVMPKLEWDALIKEKEQMAGELQELKTKATVPSEDDQREGGTSEQERLEQEAELQKLQKQLQAAKTKEAKLVAALKAVSERRDADKLRLRREEQRKEELKILYKKFSAKMDDVAAKAMEIEELKQQLEEAADKLKHAQTQSTRLEKQVEQLQQQNASLLADKRAQQDDAQKELAALRQQKADLAAENAQQMEKAAVLQAELMQLEERRKNETQSISEMVIDRVLGADVRRSKQKKRRRSDEAEALVETPQDGEVLVRHLAEKEALQLFIQRYYPAAEEKCKHLLQQVGQLEAREAQIRQQTRESCDLLRGCTEVESCSEAVRASLLDVMATLERLP